MRSQWFLALAPMVFAVGTTSVAAAEHARARTGSAAPAATTAPREVAVARSAPAAIAPAATPAGRAFHDVEIARPAPAVSRFSESGQADRSGRSRVPPSGGGSSSGGSSSGARSGGGSGGGGGHATASSSGGRTSAPSSSGGNRSSAGTAQPRQRYPDRSSDGSYYAGRAVPRGSVPSHPIYRPPYHNWYGSWYPWGFGAWGLGFYFWDPYWYGGWGYAPYAFGQGYAGNYYDVGAVRLLIKPRDAQVFVDGFYVGVVDEFDGRFQKLKLDEGPHRIEVKKDGFETLRFDVRVTFDQTIKLRGELQPVAP